MKGNKNMKKKILAKILILTMAITVLNGCGSKPSSNSSGNQNQESEVASNDEEVSDKDKVSALKVYNGADSPQEAVEMYFAAVKSGKEEYILKTLHPCYEKQITKIEEGIKSGTTAESVRNSFWDFAMWDSDKMSAVDKKFEIEILEDVQYESLSSVDESLARKLSQEYVNMIKGYKTVKTDEQYKPQDSARYKVKIITDKIEDKEYKISVVQTLDGKWYIGEMSKWNDENSNFYQNGDITEEKEEKVAAIEKYLEDISLGEEKYIEAMSPLYMQLQNLDADESTKKFCEDEVETYKQHTAGYIIELGELQEILWHENGSDYSLWNKNTIRNYCAGIDFSSEYPVCVVVSEYEAKVESRVCVNTRVRIAQGTDLFDTYFNFELVKYDGIWYVEDMVKPRR